MGLREHESAAFFHFENAEIDDDQIHYPEADDRQGAFLQNLRAAVARDVLHHRDHALHPRDQIHRAAGAFYHLAGDHPVRDVALVGHLKRSEDCEVDVPAADHRERVRAREKGQAGQGRDRLFASVNQVGIDRIVGRESGSNGGQAGTNGDQCANLDNPLTSINRSFHEKRQPLRQIPFNRFRSHTPQLLANVGRAAHRQAFRQPDLRKELVPHSLSEETMQAHPDPLIMRAGDLPNELRTTAELAGKPEAFVLRGGSAIIGPDGKYVVEPVFEAEATVTAKLDLGAVDREKMTVDVSGHYSRPDLFKLP